MSSSVNSDADLHVMVTEILEKNGVLSKIRAQLRENVIVALRKQNSESKLEEECSELKKFLSNKEGHLIFSLVRDLLKCLKLEHTLNVFDAESNNNQKTLSRLELFNEFGLKYNENPVLSQVLLATRNSSNDDGTDDKSDNELTKGTKSDTELPKSEELRDGNSEQDKSVSSDAFFDDPVPVDCNPSMLGDLSKKEPKNEDYDEKNVTQSINKEDGLQSESEVKSDSTASGTKDSGTGLTNLKDLPGLPGIAKESNIDLWDDIAAIDKRIADLGFEVPPDDEYDDDFSNVSSNNKSETEKNSASDLSIEEDIEEISDLNEHSEGDNLTSDKTISQMEDISGTDYLENLP